MTAVVTAVHDIFGDLPILFFYEFVCKGTTEISDGDALVGERLVQQLLDPVATDVLDLLAEFLLICDVAENWAEEILFRDG